MNALSLHLDLSAVNVLPCWHALSLSYTHTLFFSEPFESCRQLDVYP